VQESASSGRANNPARDYQWFLVEAEIMSRAVFMARPPISVRMDHLSPARRRERGRHRDGALLLMAEDDAITRRKTNLRERDVWS